jgi:fatty acid desaturase
MPLSTSLPTSLPSRSVLSTHSFRIGFDLVAKSPAVTLFLQLLGWPMYLIRNASGQKTYPRFTNHFNPSSVIFDKRHFRQILASDVGIAILFGVLGTWGYQRGFAEVAKFYLIPYLWVNHWLVSITFLQHTDPLVPHYSCVSSLPRLSRALQR